MRPKLPSEGVLFPLCRRIESYELFVLRSVLADEMPKEALAALRSAGILRKASRADTVPCDDPKKVCFRRVAKEDGSFVGVCKDPRGTCPKVELGDEALLREEIAGVDVVRALQVLYDADGLGIPPESSLGGRDPIFVGKQATQDGERDVLLLAKPPMMLTMALLRSRRALLLVPTAGSVPAKLRAAHGPGAFLEVEVLSEVLGVRGGKLARGEAVAEEAPEGVPSTRRGGASPPKGTGPPGKPAKDEPIVRGAKSFRDVKITLIDGTTVRIDVGERRMRLTHVDLGMAHAKTRTPTVLWAMLVAILEGRGSFKWRQFGDSVTAKQTVHRLRDRLKAIFGLPDDPFHRWSYKNGWRARFVALPELPEPRI